MRLAASLRYALYTIAALMFASGVTWLAARSVGLDGWLKTYSLRVHGGAAMALLVLIGAAAALHSAKAWRERKNRISGVLLSATLALLIVTGYLLYYLGDESARSVASIVHWAIGLALPVALAGHAWRRRQCASTKDLRSLSRYLSPVGSTTSSGERSSTLRLEEKRLQL